MTKNLIVRIHGQEIYDLDEAELVVRRLRRSIALRQYWADAKFVAGILMLGGFIVALVYFALENS